MVLFGNSSAHCSVVELFSRDAFCAEIVSESFRRMFLLDLRVRSNRLQRAAVHAMSLGTSRFLFRAALGPLTLPLHSLDIMSCVTCCSVRLFIVQMPLVYLLLMLSNYCQSSTIWNRNIEVNKLVSMATPGGRFLLLIVLCILA